MLFRSAVVVVGAAVVVVGAAVVVVGEPVNMLCFMAWRN